MTMGTKIYWYPEIIMQMVGRNELNISSALYSNRQTILIWLNLKIPSGNRINTMGKTKIVMGMLL